MKPLLSLTSVLLLACPLIGQSSEAGNNVFHYGIGLSTEYDDPSESSADGVSGSRLVYSVQPDIAIHITRPRWQTELAYAPSLTYSPERSSSYDALAHKFRSDFSRQVSKRLRFDLHSSFDLANNPFDAFRGPETLPLDVPDRSNSTTSGEVVSRRSGQVGTDLVYILGSGSRMGGGASFTRSDYREDGESSFDDSRRTVSEAAHLFYNRDLGARSSAGFRYAFHILDFGRGEFRTDSHSLMLTWQFGLTPKLSLSTFAGPNYSVSQSRSLTIVSPGNASSHDLSAVGGANFAWTGPRYGLSASATRSISDGGGARGNVRLDSFGIHANRQLSPRSSLSAFVTYNRNKLLLPVPGSAQVFNYLQGSAGFERNLTQNVSLTLFYWHIERSDEQSDGFNAGNRVGLRLAYSRQRPLGR
jgi:hypothetical protein